MRKKWRTGVPLYFSGVVVMALALFLHTLTDPSPSNVPFIVGAVGLVIAAAGQATKDAEDDEKGSDERGSLEPIIDLLEQVFREAREIRRMLEKDAGAPQRDVDVPQNTRGPLLLGALIAVLAILLRRRR
jgi:hypothetical protein